MSKNLMTINLSSIQPSQSETIILNRFKGKYENLPLFFQAFYPDDNSTVSEEFKKMVRKYQKVRRNHKSLACISGSFFSPVFSCVAWSFFGNSNFLAHQLPRLTITSKVIISIGLIRGLLHLHSQSCCHGSLSPFSISAIAV